jgi:hypothetical protein
MADYSRREVTQTWIEYTLPFPTVLGELLKTIRSVQTELGDDARWDDAAQVGATDEEIIIRWEKKGTGRD